MKTCAMRPLWLLVILVFFVVAACSGESPEQDDTDGDGQADGDDPTDGDDGDLPDGDDEPLPPFDYCEPPAPPDSACWRERRAPDSEAIALAMAIADKQLELKDPGTLRWDWGEAVLMVGLMELYAVTGETRYRDFIQVWMDHHIEKESKIGSSDTCAPAALAVFLYAETGEERYRGMIDRAMRYIEVESLRTEDGGLNHLGVLDLVGVSIWVDSLFMFGNLLTRWGELSDSAEILDIYTEQFDIFTRVLQDEGGFYTHACEHTTFAQEPGIFWGRGNGWVLAAGYDHLRVRRNRGELVPDMEAALVRLTDAAISSQDAASGLWWTILNRPGESYLETSVAALFAFGMARGYRYGQLDESVLPVIRGAIEGVINRIEYDDENRPVVTGVSGPTNPGRFETYAAVRQADDISYGLGAVIMALVESSGLPK